MFLDGQIIPRELSTRYLGAYVSYDGGSKYHLEKRILAATKSMGALHSVGMFSDCLSVKRKIDIYKVMVRSTLLYAADCTQYTLDQIKRIVSSETMMIKQALGVHKYCHNTQLFRALEIDYLPDRLNLIKLGFIMRIIEQPFTRELLYTLLNNMEAVSDIRSKRSSVVDAFGTMVRTLRIESL